MGILDWVRGKPKKPKSKLPAPTPLSPPKAQPKHVQSDIPPIRVEKRSPSMHEEVKPYSAHPTQVKPPVKAPLIQPPMKRPVQPVAQPPMMREPTKRAPMPRPEPAADMSHIFISSDEYSTIVDNANRVRSQLLETEERLQMLSQLRSTEEKELSKWQEQLVSLEKKLTYMEAVLEKAGEMQ